MPNPNTMMETPLFCYRFGTAEFDEARLELRVGGLAVELEHKPLQVLAELLRHADEVLTRQELNESVWAGRPTVDEVLSNCILKLRKALGDGGARHIVTVPRVGYKLSGPVKRVAVGRRLMSRLAVKAGEQVPGNSQFVLESQIDASQGVEVWRARHVKTAEIRVFKFSLDGERLASLKREATLYRVLRESLGDRADMVRISAWNFETPPFFLECEDGGENLDVWASADGRLRGLALQDRLEMFIQIADAVAAAHPQKADLQRQPQLKGRSPPLLDHLSLRRREGEERLDLEGRQLTRDLLQTEKCGLPRVHRTLRGWGRNSFSEIGSSN